MTLRVLAVSLLTLMGHAVGAQERPPNPDLLAQVVQEIRETQDVHRVVLSLSPGVETRGLTAEGVRARAGGLADSLGLEAVELEQLLDCPPSPGALAECTMPGGVALLSVAW